MIGFKDFMRLTNVLDFKMGLRVLSREIRIATRRCEKMSLYKAFNENVFTSLGIEIEDRRLNPNFFEECEEILDNLFEYINNKYPCKKIENIIFEMDKIVKDNEKKDTTIIFGSNKIDGEEKILDELFFIDKEPLKMTIKDYFGCEPKTRPEQLEILGERTIKIFEKCQRNVGELLYNCRIIRKKVKSIGIIFNNKKLYSMLHKLDVLRSLHTILFMKLNTIRVKTGQYILIGSLGYMAMPLFNIKNPNYEEEVIETVKDRRQSREIKTKNDKTDLELLSNQIKKVIEKIIENSENGLYKVFKENVFDSIGHKIEDRRLNPKLLEECEEFVEELFEYISSIDNDKDNITYKFTKTINNKIKVDEKALDKLFFIDEEPFKMTIKDYFGCEPKTRPEQLEILGDRTTEILKKCKRNIDELLSINNRYDLSENKISLSKNSKDRINTIYELNKMFFNKMKTVRQTVAKYILIGSIGPLFYYINEGPNSDKITVIADGLMRFND